MIQLRVRSAAEIAQLASQKLLARGGGREERVFLPANCLPPSRAYRWESFETPLGKVKLFAYPSERGGWVVRVKFESPVMFNPVVSKEEAELLKKLCK
jgi:hypothetical protein